MAHATRFGRVQAILYFSPPKRLVGPFASRSIRRVGFFRDSIQCGGMMNILTVNLALSTFVFWIAARLYLLPRLHEIRPHAILLPVLFLHSFRHLGLMFLAPGATYAGIPPQFAFPAAYGDLLAAVLALLAIPAVAVGHWSSRPLLWAFNVEGSLDLFTAITLATVYEASPYMGAAYWIPAFWVPALLVSHCITFLILIKHWTPDHL